MKDFGLLQLAENEFGLELKTSHLQEKFGTFIANRNFTQIHEILRKLSIFYAILRKVSEIYSKFYANSRNLEVFVKCGRARPISPKWSNTANLDETGHGWASPVEKAPKEALTLEVFVKYGPARTKFYMSPSFSFKPYSTASLCLRHQKVVSSGSFEATVLHRTLWVYHVEHPVCSLSCGVDKWNLFNRESPSNPADPLHSDEWSMQFAGVDTVAVRKLHPSM